MQALSGVIFLWRMPLPFPKATVSRPLLNDELSANQKPLESNLTTDGEIGKLKCCPVRNKQFRVVVAVHTTWNPHWNNNCNVVQAVKSRRLGKNMARHAATWCTCAFMSCCTCMKCSIHQICHHRKIKQSNLGSRDTGTRIPGVFRPQVKDISLFENITHRINYKTLHQHYIDRFLAGASRGSSQASACI